MSRLLLAVSLFSLVAITLFHRAALEVEKDLSPQGCRMSYMYPSYILQDGFNTTWTPLAKRYSLWLYRESSHESPKMHGGVPVLFIPGNAGSSRQVRSIASSAARQYFTDPFVPNAELVARGVKPLDFFAVEFNEDLSAFHGPTLESETEYTSKAISYILSMYPKNTSIIILGHSMGGIVATSLPKDRISAIITMSTPHALPPARFDHRVEEIYDHNLLVLKNDPTPIVSLCGGATDMMIPSESCFLPPANAESAPFRRTVFSSGLEGAWTGVGHQVMVWCHQVRWRVAKAALELEAAADKAAVLDQWLSDGHVLRPIADRSLTLPNRTMCEFIPSSMHLTLRKPRGSPMYLLAPPDASSPSFKLVLYASQGSISSLSTQDPTFQVEVFICTPLSQSHDTSIECTTLRPTIHKLMPNPPYGKLFPAPEEGAGESDGVVLFEADIPPNITETSGPWVGVQIQGAKGSGWVVGGFQENQVVVNEVSTWRLLFYKEWIPVPDTHALRTSMSFPRLLSNALVVYRADLYTLQSKCIDPLLPPLMMLSSHESETHYYPLTRFNQRRILLHTHSSAPFSHAGSMRGLNFTVYSSGIAGCSTDFGGIDLRIDWKTTFGRWASRYFTVVATWSVGVVAVIIFTSWGVYDRTSVIPSVQKALSTYSRGHLPVGLVVSLLFALVPLPERYYLGNVGNPFFAVIAPILILIASGLVFLSWCILVILMWIAGKLGDAIFGSRTSQETTYSVRRTTLVSMCLVFLLVFLFIPWQVAYLACWLIHFWNCSFAMCRKPFPGSTGTPPPTSVPLISRDGGADDSSTEPDNRISSYHKNAADNYNQSMHLLLLMTWLLPLVAPVLVVWVRTLATAGLTTPFDGDHFVLNVAPFLILVDFASWTAGPLFVKQRFERGYFSVRSFFALLAAAAFMTGPRKAYVVLDMAKVTIGLVVAVRVGPRYWGRSSWST